MSAPMDGMFVSQGGLASRITQPEPSPLTRAVTIQAEVSRELVELRSEMGVLAHGLQQVETLLDELRQQQTTTRLTAPLGQTREVAVRVVRVAALFGDLERVLSSANETMQTLRTERGQLQALCVIAEHLNSTLERSELLERVLDDLLLLVQADRGGILLIDEKGALHFEAARGANKVSLSRSDYVMSRGTIEQVWQTQKPLLAADAQHDARLEQHASVQVQGIHAIMCAPLRVQGKAIGAVYVDQINTDHPFTAQHLDLLAAFCNEAAIAIENANLFQAQIMQTQQIAAIKNYNDSILASISSAVLAVDNAGRITRTNQAIERILHIPMEEVLGKHYDQILSRLPDHTPIEAIQASAKASEVQEFALVQGVIAGQSKESTISVGWSALCDAERRRLGTVIVLDDLTELAHAQHEAKIFRRYVHPDVVDLVTQHSPAADLGGQTRDISVIFADIRGYTALSEALDPATLVGLLNEYLSIATEAILAHGGTVTMFQGDAVMAIFNAPRDQSDHAWRAVQAAWEVTQGINSHNLRVGNRQVECGIGVHTGMALVGNIGAAGKLQNYTAIGDAVNIAKRLEQNAAGNTILLSDDTYQIVARQVQAQRGEDVLAKGKSQPVRVWKLQHLA